MIHKRITGSKPVDFDKRSEWLYVAEYGLLDLDSVVVNVWRNGEGTVVINASNEALFNQMIKVGPLWFGPLGKHEEGVKFKVLNEDIEWFLSWYETGEDSPLSSSGLG